MRLAISMLSPLQHETTGRVTWNVSKQNRIYAVRRGCTYCGTCVTVCPQEAVTVTDRGAVIDPDKCTDCGLCVENCASEAIVAVESATECSVIEPQDSDR
jgi:ferredoxin